MEPEKFHHWTGDNTSGFFCDSCLSWATDDLLNEDGKQLAQALDLLRRFYYAFRRDVYTETQANACNDAEELLRIPSSERLI